MIIKAQALNRSICIVNDLQANTNKANMCKSALSAISIVGRILVMFDIVVKKNASVFKSEAGLLIHKMNGAHNGFRSVFYVEYL